MRNPFLRKPRPIHPKPTLRERATALKAAAARVMKGRGPGQVTHQPFGESLPPISAVDPSASAFTTTAGGSHDRRSTPADVTGRDPAANGGRPGQESAMGRHETFDLSTATSSGLPNPTGPASDRDPFADPNRHEGFIPYPPGKPTCFLAIDVAIPLEAERLIELAAGEIRRLLPFQSEGLDERGRLEVRASLEARFRIKELAAVASGLAAGTPAGDDELDRAIEAHLSARAALNDAAGPTDHVAARLEGRDASDEAMAPFEAAWAIADEAETTAWDSLLACRPTDPAALARMLRYVAASPALGCADMFDVLDQIAAAAEAVVPRAPTREQLDPVFALIEECQAAYEEWDRLDKIEGELSDFDPRFAPARAAAEAAGRRERAAFEAMLSAQPTTLPGLAAFAEYLPKALAQISIDGVEEDAERALRSLAGSLKHLMGHEVHSRHPDAEIGRAHV